MKKPIWRLTTVVGIVTAVAVAMTVSASAHSTKANTVKAGGTLARTKPRKRARTRSRRRTKMTGLDELLGLFLGL